MSHPPCDKLSQVEAESRVLKEAVIELKNAVVKIQETLVLIGRIEERVTHVKKESHDTKSLVFTERAERQASIMGIGERVGTLEDKLSSVHVDTKINSHGRFVFERVLIPILASALTAYLVTILSN